MLSTPTAWFVALILSIAPAFAQEAPRVYLVTVAPGAQLQSAFGHALLEVEQSAATPGRNLIYDYGQPNIGSLLTSGNLAPLLGTLLNDAVPAQVSLSSRASFERIYTAAGRTWTRDELQLTAEQAQLLAVNLRTGFMALRRTRYQYRNFYDNCATRIRDHPLWTIRGQLSG